MQSEQILHSLSICNNLSCPLAAAPLCFLSIELSLAELNFGFFTDGMIKPALASFLVFFFSSPIETNLEKKHKIRNTSF